MCGGEKNERMLRDDEKRKVRDSAIARKRRG